SVRLVFSLKSSCRNRLNSRCFQVLCRETPGSNVSGRPVALNVWKTLSTEPLRSVSSVWAVLSLGPSPGIEVLSTPIIPKKSLPIPSCTRGITLKELNTLLLTKRLSPPNRSEEHTSELQSQ